MFELCLQTPHGTGKLIDVTGALDPAHIQRGNRVQRVVDLTLKLPQLDGYEEGFVPRTQSGIGGESRVLGINLEILDA